MSISNTIIFDEKKSLSLALGLIKQFEGCVLHPYLCPAYRWTIGWGSTLLPNGQAVTQGSHPITQEAADKLLQENISALSQQVTGLVRVPINAGQQAALIDFAYNLGISRLKSSTLLKKLNAGDITGAANEFPRWDNCNGKPLDGLAKRRAAEKALFLSGK